MEYMENELEWDDFSDISACAIENGADCESCSG